MARARIRLRAAVTTMRALSALLVLAGAVALTGLPAAADARGVHAPVPARISSAGLAVPGRATGSDKPPGCFDGSPTCISSDPQVSLGFASNGDTTGCTFALDINWNDQSQDTTDTLTGGPDGTPYGPYTHKYAKPGDYTISWSTTLQSNTGSNNCVNSNGTDQFTLITGGIYANFQFPDEAPTAVADGWGLIANVAGLGRKAPGVTRRNRSGCTSPWLGPAPGAGQASSDYMVEQALSDQAATATTPPPAWISYWTPAVPPVGTGSDTEDLYADGYAAGQAAGDDIESAANAATNPVGPLYVGLDFEPSDTKGHPSALSCGKNVPLTMLKDKPKPGYKQCWDWAGARQARNCYVIRMAGWKAFARGWNLGLQQAQFIGPVSLPLAIYVNKSEYGLDPTKADTVRKFGIPVIVAVGPSATPATGPNIVGYALFGAGSSCENAPSLLKKVKEWGGITTIQWAGGKYCSPTGT